MLFGVWIGSDLEKSNFVVVLSGVLFILECWPAKPRNFASLPVVQQHAGNTVQVRLASFQQFATLACNLKYSIRQQKLQNNLKIINTKSTTQTKTVRI